MTLRERLATYKTTIRNSLLALALVGSGWGVNPAYNLYVTAKSSWLDFKIMRNYIAQSADFKAWVASKQKPTLPVAKVTTPSPEKVVE